jgi:sulfur carrier protein
VRKSKRNYLFIVKKFLYKFLEKIMEVTVIMGEDEKKMDLQDDKSIKDLLKMLKIPIETVVVKKNQCIVIEEEPVEEGDILEIIRVIYGG